MFLPVHQKQKHQTFLILLPFLDLTIGDEVCLSYRSLLLPKFIRHSWDIFLLRLDLDMLQEVFVISSSSKFVSVLQPC